MKYDANMVTLSEEEIKEYKETLANNLVALRKMLYLSQTEFGNRTGISRIRLSMIECGKYEMPTIRARGPSPSPSDRESHLRARKRI